MKYDIIEYNPQIHPRDAKHYPYGKVRSKDEWLQKCLWVHGIGRYDYSDTDFIKGMYKVCITCNTCGHQFHQRASSHSSGTGCIKCRTSNQTKTIEEAKESIHNTLTGLLDLSNALYTSADVPIKDIKCLLCGAIFHKHISSLRKGYGCPHCSLQKNYQRTTQSAKAELYEVHGETCSYEKLVYTTATEKVIITCPIHGDFSQPFNIHRKGHGCPSCAKRKATQSEISSMPQKEKNSPYSLYVANVLCKNTGLSFMKIGVTKNHEKRFKCSSYKGYDIKFVRIVTGTKEDILRLELDLLEEMEKVGARWMLTPMLKGKFAGWSECYLPELFDPHPIINSLS